MDRWRVWKKRVRKKGEGERESKKRKNWKRKGREWR